MPIKSSHEVRPQKHETNSIVPERMTKNRPIEQRSHDFQILFDQASTLIEQARSTAYRQINETLVRRNWLLGQLIAKEELNGENRAKYGLDAIKGLAKHLTAKYGKGFTKTNLYSFSQFYKMYPKIFHTACGKSETLLSWSHYRTLIQELNSDARAYVR